MKRRTIGFLYREAIVHHRKKKGNSSPDRRFESLGSEGRDSVYE